MKEIETGNMFGFHALTVTLIKMVILIRGENLMHSSWQSQNVFTNLYQISCVINWKMEFYQMIFN